MKKILLILVVLLAAGALAFAGGGQESGQGGQQGGGEPAGGSGDSGMMEEPVSFTLWSQEGESEGVFQWVVDLTERFMEMNPNVTIDTVQKDTEALREDFQTASLAGAPPELLWTVNDHAGPFTVAGLIQPVDDLYDEDDFVESVNLENRTWAIPISSGNHLMLLYNRSLVDTPPTTTDEMIAVARDLTDGETYGLVYNATEPFWLVPWLGGFGGRVFAADGVTPTLDTPQMIDTLEFLASLEFDHGIVPPEADYATMDTLFKEGKAAMIINGDWSLGDYAGVLGDDLGVAPLPRVSSTGLWPAPYTSGKYFMIADGVDGATLDAIMDFVDFVTSEEVQLEMLETFSRLPALLSALDDPSIQSDPVLLGSTAQMANGTPQPSVVEMRANWDAMKPEMIAVLSGTVDPETAAENMQAAAEAGVRALQ